MQIDTRINIGMIGGNPHRFPMVLMDRVIENGSKVITEKFVSLNDYVFRHADFKTIKSLSIRIGWLLSRFSSLPDCICTVPNGIFHLMLFPVKIFTSGALS
jgi:hypothetical protein